MRLAREHEVCFVIMDTQEASINLIKLYASHTMLWDPKNPKYLNKSQREDAWKQIALEMRCTVSDAKKKMESLLGSYRREKNREKKRRVTGSGADDVYTSKWFGYRHFDFMKNKNEPGNTRDTEESQRLNRDSEVFEDNRSASSVQAHATGSTSLTQTEPTASTSLTQAETTASTLLTQAETTASTLLTQAELTGFALSTQAEPSGCYINKEGPPQLLQAQCTSDTSTSTQEPPRKKRRNNPKPQPQEDIANIMLADALQCLQKSTDETLDPHYSFGRHIANELRKYDPHTLACVKNAINNIIFEADMGKYTQQYPQGYFTQQYPQESPSTQSHAASSPSTTASQFDL